MARLRTLRYLEYCTVPISGLALATLPVFFPILMALTSNILFLVTFISLLPLQVSAFGAGDIPEFSYLNSSSLLFIL